MKLYDVPVILCFVGALMVLDFDKSSVKALITGVLLGLWVTRIYYRRKIEFSKQG